MKMRKQYFINYLCLLFICPSSFAQSSTLTDSIDRFIDEMHTVLEHKVIENETQVHQEKINQLQQQLDTYTSSNLTVEIYTQLAYLYRNIDDVDSAEVYVHKAHRYAEDPNHKIAPLTKVDALHELAKNYEYHGEIRLALEYYNKALTLLDKQSSSCSSAITLKKISKIRLGITMLYQAQEGYMMLYKQLKLFKDFTNANNLSSTEVKDELWFYNCSNTYYQHLGNTDSAFLYLKKGFLVAQKKKDFNFIARHLHNLIALLVQVKEYKKAKQHFERLLPNTIQTGNSWAIARLLRRLALVSSHIGALEDALMYAESGYKFAKKSKNKLIMLLTNKELAELYYRVKRSDEAYQLLQESMTLENVFRNTQQLKQSQLAELEFRESALALEKKEKEWQIKSNQQKSNIIILVSCFSLVSIALAYMFYLDREKKKKVAELLRQQKEKLEELDGIKSRFFANISHELRTPLTLISSPIQHLINSKQLSSDTQRYLQLVARSSRQLKDLVNNILDLSKLESNKIQLHQKKVRIEALLMRISASFELLAQHHGIHFNTAFEGLAETWLFIDATKVEKVLNNLLSNAIKYTPSGKSVTFTANKTSNYLSVCVKDTGKGISSDDLPNIFERFFQSKEAHIPIQGGTGIGLALVKELTELMGGELSVESQEGKGTSFVFQIPLIEVTPSSVEIKADTQLEEASDEVEEFADLAVLSSSNQLSAKYLKLLVVEDNPDMQQFIKGVLQDKYHVVLAVNGKEALKILQSETIDLIITDAMMPEMDGYELLQKLKSLDSYRGIPIIMLTALHNEASKLKSFTIGVDDYLTKPFSVPELLARINNLLMRAQVKQEVYESEWHEASTSVLEKASIKSEGNIIVIINPKEIEWLEEVAEVIQQELTNPDFRLSELHDRFHMSERKFQRKVKQIVGMTPKKYQQELALQEARALLEKAIYGNMTGIAYAVGINNVTRFSRLYEDRFGKNPNAYFN